MDVLVTPISDEAENFLENISCERRKLSFVLDSTVAPKILADMEDEGIENGIDYKID
jgi:hypothetical protein